MPSRHRLALPLACGSLAGALAAVLMTAGPPGIDTPAHLFMTWAFRHTGFRLWNSYWYDGRYDFVGYSLVFYPVASVAGGPLGSAARRGAAGMDGVRAPPPHADSNRRRSRAGRAGAAAG